MISLIVNVSLCNQMFHWSVLELNIVGNKVRRQGTVKLLTFVGRSLIVNSNVQVMNCHVFSINRCCEKNSTVGFNSKPISLITDCRNFVDELVY